MEIQAEPTRVYLDNAATSWPKSTAAVAAAANFVAESGATAGRGTYTSAATADRWLQRGRDAVARLIGALSGNDIAFCHNGTHALNAALAGLLQPGDHVLTTVWEHNSLLRPLRQLQQTRGIRFSTVDMSAAGEPDWQQADSLIEDTTRLIAVGHASNVTGVVTWLDGWRELADRHQAKLLVDASQSLGYVPVTVGQVDVLAAAAHKGLRALAGTGILYVKRDLQSSMVPLMSGGTGRDSESIDAQPAWPQVVEVGNLNLPGVVSVAVAAEELAQLKDLTEQWTPVFERLRSGLEHLSGVRVLSPLEQAGVSCVPVVSILVDGWDVHDLATVLDTNFGIEVRAGWHCAALTHASIGSEKSHGTLRLSPGRGTSMAEIDYTLQALRDILGQ